MKRFSTTCAWLFLGLAAPAGQHGGPFAPCGGCQRRRQRHGDHSPALSADEIARLLGSCDRQTGRGRRDNTVLVVLSRLGLRANEVARLCLDEIGWRAGEVVVHNGKGRREERLPLPSDVGEALADYLQHGRPATAPTRTVVARLGAPLVGLSSSGVTWVVYNACSRAGIRRVGAHCLRHTAATTSSATGASTRELMARMGHASPRAALLYQHATRERDRVIADALGTLLDAAGPTSVATVRRARPTAD